MLQKWFSEGKLKRDDLFITTKLPIQGINVDRVEKFLKDSLEKLQLEYLDLYLLHCSLGAKTDEAGTGFTLDAKGQVALEGRTDFAAIWKVDTRWYLTFSKVEKLGFYVLMHTSLQMTDRYNLRQKVYRCYYASVFCLILSIYFGFYYMI